MWYPLYRAVKGKYRLFCKVRLADVVWAPKSSVGDSYWFRKIRGYHVDFLVCDPESTQPLLVVELDDQSHRTDRQRELDQFKDDVLRAASVPIYRVPAASAYDVQDLTETVARLIATSDDSLRRRARGNGTAD